MEGNDLNKRLSILLLITFLITGCKTTETTDIAVENKKDVVEVHEEQTEEQEDNQEKQKTAEIKDNEQKQSTKKEFKKKWIEIRTVMRVNDKGVDLPHSFIFPFVMKSTLKNRIRGTNKQGIANAMYTKGGFIYGKRSRFRWLHLCESQTNKLREIRRSAY